MGLQVDVCEVGGTAPLADAMAELCHAQLTGDLVRADEERRGDATFDLRREVGSGNLWTAV